MSKFDIAKFDGKISFATWRVQMLVVLTQNGLKKVLTGKMMRPTTVTEEQWDEMDKKILFAIQLCLSREVLREVINEKIATGIWSKLEIHDQKSCKQTPVKGATLYTLNVRRYSHPISP